MFSRRLPSLVQALALCAALAAPAAAADTVYFSKNTNVTDILVNYINRENVRLDISSWYLSEHSISIAIANRFHAGVPVRLIGDRGSIFEADPHTKSEFYWLASQGVPIRLRFNPTWFPEINHWKAAIFVGQNTVAFGSANFAPTELAPYSSTNFDDEPRQVDIVIYRLEVDNITEAILAKYRSGVAVRVIVDPQQYTKVTYPEYWLTHANLDKLCVAGVPIRQGNHDGVTHMKMLIT